MNLKRKGSRNEDYRHLAAIAYPPNAGNDSQTQGFTQRPYLWLFNSPNSGD